MGCNYFTYREMTEKIFYGVPLTESYLNNATEQVRQYLVDGGAGNIVKALGIGIKVEEKRHLIFPELNEVVKCRFVFVDGERKGEELTIDEIRSIGLFLKHGPFYGKLAMPEPIDVRGMRNATGR